MTEEVPRKQLAGMKILVVEDEEGMAQVLRRGLEEDNHDVSLASEDKVGRDAAWNQRDSGGAPISRTPARHCGSIEEQSTLGNGSVFCITLPLATNR